MVKRTCEHDEEYFSEIDLDKELKVFLLEGSKSGVWDSVVLVRHWKYKVKVQSSFSF